MSRSSQLVVFTIDGQRCALFLPIVDRVIHAVEVTSLPKAPEIILGVINMHGQIVPVINLRRRFGFRDKDLDLTDRFIIAQTSRRLVALLVDRVEGVVHIPEETMMVGDEVLPGLDYIQGIAKLEDGLVLIHDIDTFLSLDEERALDAALQMDT